MLDITNRFSNKESRLADTRRFHSNLAILMADEAPGHIEVDAEKEAKAKQWMSAMALTTTSVADYYSNSREGIVRTFVDGNLKDYLYGVYFTVAVGLLYADAGITAVSDAQRKAAKAHAMAAVYAIAGKDVRRGTQLFK